MQEWEIRKRQWARVTSNLINNMRIDELSITVALVNGLHSLSAHYAYLYEMLAKAPDSVTGFSSSQFDEECRKAALIMEDISWSLCLRM